MKRASESSIPIESWANAMADAIDRICEVGREVLETHSANSSKARKVAEDWKLAERLDDEHAALKTFFANARAIAVAVEALRQDLDQVGCDWPSLAASLRRCGGVIEDNVPGIEDAFLVSRHSAIDLLRWVEHDEGGDRSELTLRYRKSYADLVSYSPVFKPYFEQMIQRLLGLGRQDLVAAEANSVLVALTRYNALADSARSFVRSIVEPPLELVFHETESFIADWELLTHAERGDLATEFNDCCQLLLYDEPGFDRQAEVIHVSLCDGVDASLFAFTWGEHRILFTVDRDPVFDELVITLLHVVQSEKVFQIVEKVKRTLYEGLSDSNP